MRKCKEVSQANVVEMSNANVSRIGTLEVEAVAVAVKLTPIHDIFTRELNWQIHARCPFCGVVHLHGNGGPELQTDAGWRAPHCGRGRDYRIIIPQGLIDKCAVAGRAAPKRRAS